MQYPQTLRGANAVVISMRVPPAALILFHLARQTHCNKSMGRCKEKSPVEAIDEKIVFVASVALTGIDAAV
ncbi:MAG: hypothetical protein IJ157_05740 [Clostridia bacterium]|nr:hypothetical protein [Clostridia bacterium]